MKTAALRAELKTELIEEQVVAVGRFGSRKDEAIADLVLEVAQFFFRMHRTANCSDESDQSPAHAATGGRACGRGACGVYRQSEASAVEAGALTRKGDAHYRKLSARFLAITSTMGADLSEMDIRKTAEIVRRLRDEPKGRW